MLNPFVKTLENTFIILLQNEVKYDAWQPPSNLQCPRSILHLYKSREKVHIAVGPYRSVNVNHVNPFQVISNYCCPINRGVKWLNNNNVWMHQDGSSVMPIKQFTMPRHVCPHYLKGQKFQMAYDTGQVITNNCLQCRNVTVF